jgi:hypothetical protein
VFNDESGADLTVRVEGEEYHTEAFVDIDSDGLEDTAIVETDDGTITFTDTDADGQADLMTRLDAGGDIVGQAHFDAASDQWVRIDQPDPSTVGSVGGVGEGGGSMTADVPGGEVEVGPATHDTDGDGIDDSVLVDDADGDTMVVTDADEDGKADYITEITGDGHVTVSEHTGDGHWTVIERGRLDGDGDYHRDPLASETSDDSLAEQSGWISSASQPDAAEIHIDPRTGEWTRG